MPSSFSDRYPPIGDYGLIGDSRACALVSKDGSVDWMCLPRFDSPSLFGRLLDWERGGYFQIAPDVPYEASHRYLDGTNVLETTFRADDGIVVLTDLIPAMTEEAKSRALSPLRSLFRRVEAQQGRVPMRLEYVPRPDYARGALDLRADSHYTVTASRGRHITHLRSDVALDASRFDARASFTAAAGAVFHFSMAYSFGEPAVVVPDEQVEQAFVQTVAYWRTWSDQCTYTGRYRAEVLRSALALKLLAYAPSGAIIAAPTTSLPEEIGGERNYDYRYCWLRDAAFTVKALLTIGFKDEADAFAGWLLHATNLTAPRLDPLYTLHGESHVPEKQLAHFEGYRRSRPVRIGNLASSQHQLDVYGELIDALHFHITKRTHHVSADEAAFIRRVADHVADIWREPDGGIWEARAEPLHYTHSKVMAWDALIHAADLAEKGMIKGDAVRWRREADEIARLVLERGYNSKLGAFTQTLDGETLDASVLAFPIIGFIEADDPRMLSTIDVVERALSSGGFLRRYAGFDDGLSGGEGAFLVCNFWLAAALAQAGRVDEARAVFERTLEAANDLGLLAEECDPADGSPLGNFPQGFSHLGLIVAALDIEAAEARLRAPGPSVMAQDAAG